MTQNYTPSALVPRIGKSELFFRVIFLGTQGYPKRKKSEMIPLLPARPRTDGGGSYCNHKQAITKPKSGLTRNSAALLCFFFFLHADLFWEYVGVFFVHLCVALNNNNSMLSQCHLRHTLLEELLLVVKMIDLLQL